MLFSDERITLEADEIAETETYDEESLHMRQLLKTKLIDMDLSVRALNCLKAAEVDTLGDLVSFNKSDLMKFRNFGKKSLTELKNWLLLKDSILVWIWLNINLIKTNSAIASNHETRKESSPFGPHQYPQKSDACQYGIFAY